MESSAPRRTLSVQLTVAPISKQVEDLEKLLNSRRGGAIPDLVTTATAIREAACKLQQVAIMELSRFEDRVSFPSNPETPVMCVPLLLQQLKVDLPMACHATVKASEHLVEAARRLRQQPTSRQAKTLLLGATRDIKTGLGQVRKADVPLQWRIQG